MKYEEVVSGYKKSLGLLKQVDKKVYKLFIRELKKVGSEELTSLMAQLKFNMGATESMKNGVAKQIKCHNLDKKYIKGKHQILRLAIGVVSRGFSLRLETKTLFGRKKEFNINLFPIEKEQADSIVPLRFATSCTHTNHNLTSRKFYSVSKEESSYIVRKSDALNDKHTNIALSSIPEEETILTTPFIGY